MRHPFEPSFSVIILPADLEGRFLSSARLVLDTGASFVMIPWWIARSLKLNAEETREKLTITTASGTEVVPLVNLKSMTVLGQKHENVPVIVHDLPPQTHADGLLGLSFLKHFKLTVDFKEGFVEIE